MNTTRDIPSSSVIEVITSVERRRHWTPEEKRALVEEAEQPGMSISLVARKHNISASQIFKWRRLMREGALCAVKGDQGATSLGEMKQLQAKVRELERLVGRKTLENEILREAVKIAREKKLISAKPLRGIEGFQ